MSLRFNSYTMESCFEGRGGFLMFPDNDKTQDGKLADFRPAGESGNLPDPASNFSKEVAADQGDGSKSGKKTPEKGHDSTSPEMRTAKQTTKTGSAKSGGSKGSGSKSGAKGGSSKSGGSKSSGSKSSKR
jgi:uncharacterized membrane protein YgcG